MWRSFGCCPVVCPVLGASLVALLAKLLFLYIVFFAAVALFLLVCCMVLVGCLAFLVCFSSCVRIFVCALFSFVCSSPMWRVGAILPIEKKCR